MQDSIFTKIIRGEIPSHKVYEDANTFAFLDIEPFFPGHVLVVPKLQVDQFDDLPEEDYQALFRTVKKVAKQVKTKLGAKRAIILTLGFDVPHAHIHVLPANSGKEFFEATAHHLNTEKPYPYQPSQNELAEMAAKVRMKDGA